jgi:hypothetical protein
MATIVGLDSTTKILNDASVFTQSTGLQTLSQTYTVTRAGLSDFVPSYLDPHPDFPTMAVESYSTQNLDGELARLQINYIGLLAAGAEKYITYPSSQIPSQPTVHTITFPKPNISLPTAPVGSYLHFPFVVNLQFIETQNQQRINSLIEIFNAQTQTKMPQAWRGLVLPNSPVQPYTSHPQPGTTGSILYYFGVVCKAMNIEKRGFFSLVYVTFGDSYSYSD